MTNDNAGWTLLEMPAVVAERFRHFVDRHRPGLSPKLSDAIDAHVAKQVGEYQQFIDEKLDIGIPFHMPVRCNGARSAADQRYTLEPLPKPGLVELETAEDALRFSNSLIGTVCGRYLQGQTSLIEQRYSDGNYVVPKLESRGVDKETIHKFVELMKSPTFELDGHREHYVTIGDFDYADPTSRRAAHIIETTGIPARIWQKIQAVEEERYERRNNAICDLWDRTFPNHGRISTMLSESGISSLTRALKSASRGENGNLPFSGLHRSLTLPRLDFDSGRISTVEELPHAPSQNFIRSIKGRLLTHPVSQAVIADEIGRIAGIIGAEAKTLSEKADKEEVRTLHDIQAEACDALASAAAKYKTSLGRAAGMRAVATDIGRA